MNHPESAPTSIPAPVNKKRWLFALKLTAVALGMAVLGADRRFARRKALESR